MTASATAPTVTPDAYLTLHYRLADAEGNNLVTTFGATPATLMLGQGQLAPALEACLLGLAEGTHQTFDLPPGAAFGERNPDMIMRVSRKTLDENSDPGSEYKVGDLVDFAAPKGGRFAGVLLALDADGATFDFNHPLAGKAVKFEVELLSVL